MVGSCLVFLARRGFYGAGRVEDRLARCHEHAVAFAKAAGGGVLVPEFTKATLNCETISDFPEMEGKGSLVKLLLGFVCEESRLFAVANGGAEAVAVAKMTSQLQKAINIMDRSAVIMDEAAVAAAARCLRTYQSEYVKLASAAADAHENLWKLRPKFHVLAHLSMFMEETHLNPRFWACWMDEDFMAKCRNLCQRVRARGVAVARNAMQRYVWARAELAFQGAA